MSAAALAHALDAETDALAGGAPPADPSIKLALLDALVDEAPDPAALQTLAHAARRNAAALAVRRDAAQSLLVDLHARLADAADDGTYTRAEVLGLSRGDGSPVPAAMGAEA